MSKVTIVTEIWSFLKERKKLIFLPLIVLLILLAVFAIVAEVPILTPFIYALF